jgi:hypothetical protein
MIDDLRFPNAHFSHPVWSHNPELYHSLIEFSIETRKSKIVNRKSVTSGRGPDAAQ